MANERILFMKKELESRFVTRQYMLAQDFEW